MASEECCIVCAEPLRFVGVGPCGHADVCSVCVARMRGVMDDRKCCICKQDVAVVFITRSAGTFTYKPSARELRDSSGLRRRVEAGELYHNEYIGAYFDDAEHAKEIEAFTRVSCSVCPPRGGHPLQFKNIGSLKQHLKASHGKYMCDVCLEGKKVFLCEQKLYTKQQLERHKHQGDVEVDGPPGQSGFSGHPKCKFCKKHFYGPNELYTHMQQTHFWCDICRKREPNSFSYYDNYEELARHFDTAHYACHHPECEERRFVVFQSEAEFKRHVALEHSGNLSRCQVREAMRLPTNFSVSETTTESSSSGREGRGGGGRSGRSGRGGGRGRQPIEDAILCPPAAVEDVPTWETAPTLSEAYGTQRAQPSQQMRQGTWARGGPGSNFVAEMDFPDLAGNSNSNSNTNSVGGANSHQRPTRLGRASSSSSSSRAREPRQAQGWGSSTRVADALPEEQQARAPAPLGWAEAPAMASVSGRRTTSASGSGASRPPPPPAPARQAAMPTMASRIASQQNPTVLHSPWMSQENQQQQAVERAAPRPPEVSDSVRAANKELIKEIQKKLRNPQAFTSFKEVSAAFRGGQMSTADYYQHVVSIGLGDLVPKLASLLPDAAKRDELFAIHRNTPTLDTLRRGGGGEHRAFTQPKTMWACEACTLHNAPDESICAACGSPRNETAVPLPLEVSERVSQSAPPRRSRNQSPSSSHRLQAQQRPPSPGIHAQTTRLPAPPVEAPAPPVPQQSNPIDEQTRGMTSAAEDPPHVAKKTGKKKGRKPKFERLRLGEDYEPSPDVDDLPPRVQVHPQNSWTQGSGASAVRNAG